MTFNIIEFLSRDCKSGSHHKCFGIWHGLGLEVRCYCKCHGKEEKEALELVGEPVANAIQRILSNSKVTIPGI